MTSATKKLRSLLCMLLTLMLTLTMVSFPASAASYSLNYSSYNLTKGYAITLKVKGASSETITWSTSDKSIATVSSSGKVVGKSVGTATISANINGTVLNSKINVVGGKLSADTYNVSVKEGDSTYVYITAKGSHGLKASSSDKTIATAAWVKPWDGNTIRLKIKGVKSGTTTVKVLLSKYTDIYITLNVTVGDGTQDAGIITNANYVNTNVNETATLNLYAVPAKGLTYTMSDKTIASVTEGTWNGNYVTLTIKGLKKGSTTLVIARSENSKASKTITINVAEASNSYYVITTSLMSKISATDTILKWTDSKTGVVKYMLVPSGYDKAYVNTLIAKDKNLYDYYVVFDAEPAKQLSSDKILNFTADVTGTDGKTASKTRYILVPEKYDVGTYNTAVAQYTGVFEYWTIYNVSPNKFFASDTIHTYTTAVNYISTTRYILLPYGYSESRLQDLINSDGGTSDANGYYTVTTQMPTKKADSDVILTFYAARNNVSNLYYVLVPADYDEAKYNDVVAAFTGTYDEWKIYNTVPKKNYDSETIESWTKLIDSKSVKRYILLPPGYSTELLEQIKNADLGTQSSAYYVVSVTYPTAIDPTDTVYQWYNATSKTYKYMLLPKNPDILKRNDTVYSDTKVFEYFTIYSTTPSKKKDTDEVKSFYSTVYGKMIYILLPKGYTQEQFNAALNGETVYYTG
ncbi:MAG: Ig domain-containing protein [Huintestinicola sp.]